MSYYGNLILRERLARSWSQAGLCKDICTVSYLSKIETGKAQPSADVLRLLLARLGLHTDPALEAAGARCAEDGYERLFTGRFGELAAALPAASDETYRATAAWTDLLLLRQFDTDGGALDAGLEAGMTPRQLAMQRLLQGRWDEALALLPNAFCHWRIGVSAYEAGCYEDAVEHLQAGYDLAARDGAARLMLLCRAYMGNCYCNRRDIERMRPHYTAARRLAQALGEQELLDSIAYNTAAVQIERGQFEEAYGYFSALDDPGVLALHKLAICCEKTGRTAEAYAALERAEAAETAEQRSEAVEKMLAVVHFRLAHPDYLHCDAYGALLLDCFACCRTRLPLPHPTFPFAPDYTLPNAAFFATPLNCRPLRPLSRTRDFPLRTPWPTVPAMPDDAPPSPNARQLCPAPLFCRLSLHSEVSLN